MNRIVRSILVAVLALPAFAFAAETWNIDTAHSQAAFSVKHLLISTVRGDFDKTSGKVVLDESDVTKSTVEASIEVSSVNTRDEKRDAHLKAPEFFDAAKFPTITFKSTKVEKAGEGLKVTGDLTMKGVTKQVVLDVTGPTKEIKDPWGLSRRGVSATTKVNRKDFGVSYGPDAVVSDLVTITIDAELVKAAAPAPAAAPVK
jgi:polyisoprenoid-binding protein YceI